MKRHIIRVHSKHCGVYGARKVWLQLRREGLDVARCTVERLMGELGLAGAHRGRRKRTTIPDPQAPRATDLVKCDFDPLTPNLLWVADFTYLSTWSGWVYVEFEIDAYARRILGWRCSTSMMTPLVLDAIEQSIWTRQRDGVMDLTGVVHHNDRGNTPPCVLPRRWRSKDSPRRSERSATRMTVSLFLSGPHWIRRVLAVTA